MLNVINKKRLKQLIEPNFHNNLKQDNYKIQTIKAKNLLTNTRLDLAFKLLYLEMKDKGVKFSNEIYKEHIRAFSAGTFEEPDNVEKNNIEKFIQEFDAVFEDIKINGFDANKTLIPLDDSYSIANGAHRVASAIYLNKEVKCVHITKANHYIYDYQFFFQRNVPSKILDIMATKFIEYAAANTYIAFLWPSVPSHDDKIIQTIPNIVYKKELKLSLNGAHNLLSQIYYGEEWIVDIKNNFKGIQGKLIECFKTFDPLRVIVFQADSLTEVLAIKDKIRNIFNIGKHAPHITDTKEEAIRIARIVLNDNSIHFLNYANPNKYISIYNNIAKFKKIIKEKKINKNDVILDGGIILSVYGIRKFNDIDYLVNDNSKLTFYNDEFECHDSQLIYHDIKKSELIYNPQNYFYFNDIKFISFKQIYKMKKNRNESKDIVDCEMMKALLKDDKIKIFFNKLRQYFYYGKIKTRIKLIKFLRFIGLYSVIKSLYSSLKNE